MEVRSLRDGRTQATITFKKAIPIKSITKNASIALGEAYMDGTITVDGNLQKLIILLTKMRTAFSQQEVHPLSS